MVETGGGHILYCKNKMLEKTEDEITVIKAGDAVQHKTWSLDKLVGV